MSEKNKLTNFRHLRPNGSLSNWGVFIGLFALVVSSVLGPISFLDISSPGSVFSVPTAQAAVVIDPVRRSDWSAVGVPGGIPNRTTICQTLNPGATAANINSAIASCAAGGVVMLAAGNYTGLAGINFAGHNNVTLRGAGANSTFLNLSGGGIGCNGLGAHICMIPSGTTDWNQDSPGTVANWTAGYAQGATQITLASVSGLAAGRLIMLDRLDQAADTPGDVWMCANTADCTEQGTDIGRGSGANKRGQTEIHTVVSVAGNVVTITPGLLHPNWGNGQSPQAWWAGSAPATGMGIEDMSLNYSNSSAQYGMQIQMCDGCWVKGIRSINPGNAHVNLYLSTRVTIRDSYFYGSQDAASQSYGFEPWMGGNHLWENNIFQHSASPMVLSGASGVVAAYNYASDDYYCKFGCSGWFQAAMYHHESGSSENLWESNTVPGLNGDGIHGPGVFTTVFRNRIDGKDPLNSDNKTAQTVPITLSARYRFFNIIGNVLGTNGYHNTYEVNTTTTGAQKGGANCDTAIYRFGWAANCDNTSDDAGLLVGDPTVDDLAMRWGNWDTVTSTNETSSNDSTGTRFVSSEVPSGLAKYANAVPADQTLPASFYLSGTPSFWTTPWGTPPWPAIGPDVSGGNIPNVGGHAYKIPSQLCYEHLTNDPAFAANTVKLFNANTCYAGGTPTFDFSMSNSGNVSVVQGSSTSNTATATLLSGTTTGVTFTASGFPSGAAGSFSPTSCNPTCSSTLNITTSASTPAASSTITITGTAGSTVHTSTFTLTVTSGTDTTPPTVSISSPTAGANVSGTTSVTSNAADNVGVAGVQFKLDGNNLGAEDVTAPYSVSWDTTTASSGSHVLTAVARDTSNNLTTSAGVSVTVGSGGGDTTPPTVSISAPGAGANVSGSTTTVSATATDNIGVVGVQFRLDGANLNAEDTTSPYSITWNTTTTNNGTHLLTAVARDAAGNSTTSSSVSVNVNNVSTFDFSVATSGNVSVAQGSSVNNTVTATLVTGTPQAVTFSATGLPTGASAAFAPTSCSPTCTSTLTVTTTGSTPAGTSTITVTGTAGATVRTTTFTLTVSSVSNKFVIGDRIIIVTAAATRGTPTINTTNLGTHAVGDLGTIVGGPVTADGGVWWQIDYDTAPDGWSGFEDRYNKYTAPTFDFSLANTGNKSVAQGSPATNTISASLVSGTAQAVSFSASGLPGNASASFSPTSCSPSCSSTLTITTTASTPISTSTITVTGTAGSTTHTTTFTLSVTQAPDTQAPTVSITAPAVNATVATSTTVSATATDNIGVVGVQFKLDGANLNAEDTTSPYSITWDTTTTTNGPHTITAVARDAAGNSTTSAGTSVSVSNITSDTTPPSVPTNLTATATSSSQVNLTWTASTDSVGVTGYKIFRNGTQVASNGTTTSYSDLGLNSSTLYTYNVSAFDAAGNNSGQSTAASATTQAPAFNFSLSNGGAKTVPQASNVTNAITATLASGNPTAVSFSASGLPTGATASFSPASCSPNCSTTVTITTSGTTPIASSTITITGTAGAIVQTTSFSLTVTDGVAPTVSLTAPAVNATVSASTTVSGTASDNVGVVGVQFKLDGVNLNAEDTTSPYSISWDTTSATNTTHTLTAVARDAAGNLTTSASRTVTVSNVVNTGDTTPPTVPTNLATTATSATQINLSWTASTDNTAVTGYKVYRNGTQVATNITQTSYADTGLTPSTNYSYTVSAFDAANNNSAQSSGSSTTTLAPADTIAPTVSISAPADTATVSATVTISAAANDNVGVVGVQFKRDGLNLGAEVTNSPYSFSWDTTVVTNGNHTLTAVARDAAGNSTTSVSITVNVSNTVIISTDTTPPTVPTQLSASSASSSQINLTWTASTDNIGVAGYKIYRNGTQVATAITATNYSDSGLSSSTTYSYAVQAYDAANNISALTTAVNATTQAPPAPPGGGTGGGGTNPPPPPPPGSGTTVRPDMYPPGCIFKYAGNATVYILGANNVANPITAWSVYVNQVPATRSIITIPDYVTFTIGPVLGLRSGTLIKASNDPTVYLVVSGQREAFSSEQQFHDHNYNFSNVYSIDDINLVNSMPITTAAFVRPIGTLFKYANSPAVYFLNGAGLKRGYTSIQMFNIWNATLKDVVTIPDSETYPDGPIATLPDGIAVKGSGATIYFTYNGTLRPFNDATLLTSMGMTLAQVKTFPDADIARQSIGSPMQ